MTIEFQCQHCDKVLKTSDDKGGRKAKCPQCGEPVDVPLPSDFTKSNDHFHGFDKIDSENPLSEEESFLADSPIQEEDSFLAHGNTDCPMCGASISPGVTICQACGETLQASGGINQWEPRIIKAGEVFSRSWNLFKTNLGKVVGIHVVAYIFSMIAGAAVMLLFFMIGFGGAMLIRPDPNVLIILGIIFYLVFILFSMVIQYYFMLGLQSFLLKLVRGEHPTFGELFSGGPYLARMLLCSLVFMLLGTVCYLFLIIPGLIFILVFWPYSFMLIDRNLPGIDAFTESRKITRGNLLSMFLIYLVMMAVILVPYVSIVAMVGAMDQGGGQELPAIAGLILFGFFGMVYLLLVPFFMLVGTVSYAEMTNQ